MSKHSHYALQVTRVEGITRKSENSTLYYKTEIDGRELRNGFVRESDVSTEIDTLTFSSSNTAEKLYIRVKESSSSVVGYAKYTMTELLEKCRNGEGRIELFSNVSRGSAGAICVRLEEIEMGTRAAIDIKSATRCIDRIMRSAKLANANDTAGSFVEMADKVIMAAGDAISSVNPLITVAWKATTALYKVISRQFKNDKSFVDLIKALADAFEFARDADALSSKATKLTDVIGELFAETIECCLFAEGYVGNNFFGRIFHVNNGWKIEDHTTRLADLRGKLDTSVGLHTAASVGQVLNKADQIDSRMQTSESRERLKWLQDRLQPNRSDTRNRPRCLANTRTKYIERIKDWLFSDTDQNILWLKGVAGSGKSTIAASTRDYCDDQSCLAAYLFFERGKDEHRSIIQSVAYQLASFEPAIAYQVYTAVSRVRNIDGASAATQFETLLLEPLKAAANVVKSPVLIILDALDECGTTEQRREILKLLKMDFADLPMKFRFLVTSRPEDDIMSSLRARRHILEVELDHTSAESRHDVDAYLDIELRGIMADVSDDLIKALCDAANGLFIWAATVIRTIHASDDPLEDLQTLVQNTGSLGSDHLDKLYATVLQQSGIDWKRSRSKNRFTRVMGLVLFAKEAPTCKSIEGVLGFEAGKARLTLQRLQSVIHYEAGRAIRTHHASVGDYLTSSERSGNKPWFIDTSEEMKSITTRCFDVMKESLRFNIGNLETSFIYNDCVPNLEDRIAQNIPPHLSYACRFWAEHLCDAPRSADCDDLLDELGKFAYDRLLYWFEVLSLTGNFKGVASRSLYNAFMWVPINEHELATFLWDAYRLANHFAVPIAQSTPHIYLSALSLRKSESVVANHYSKTHPTVGVHVLGTKPPDPCIKILEGHTRGVDRVWRVAVSADGKYIGASVDENTVRIWDAESGELVVEPLESDSYIMSVAFMSDGKRVAAVSQAFEDCLIYVWSTESGDLVLGPFKCHERVRGAAFSHDGKRVAIGYDDGSVLVWNVEDGSLILGPLQTDYVTALAFSPNEDFIVSASKDEPILIWNAKTGAVVRELSLEHTSSVSCVDISLDGKYIASGHDDESVRIWDLESETVLGPLRGHTSMINSIAFSPDRKLVASGSDDRTIHIWDAAIGELVSGPLIGHTSVVRAVSFFPDGNRIVSCSDDDTVRIWEVEMSVFTRRMQEGHKARIDSVAFSPDGQYIASGAWDGSICIWEVQSGRVVSKPFTFKCFTSGKTCVTYSSDGKLLAASTADYMSVRIWSAESGEVVLGPAKGSVAVVTFSPDGKRLACAPLSDIVGYRDHDIVVWSVESGEVILAPLRHTTYVTSISFSPDGSLVASGSYDYSIRVWSISSGGDLFGPIKGHTDSVNSVAFSPNGRLIASGSHDKTVRIWSTETGELVSGPFEGHTNWINSVAFSPNGVYVVSGSRDCSVRVWEVESGQTILGPLLSHTKEFTCVAFSPCGRYVAASSADHTIRIWRMENDVASGNVLDEHTERDSLPTCAGRAEARKDTPVNVLCAKNDMLQSLSEADSLPNWKFFEDGWVRGNQGELLTWIPDTMHATLLTPQLVAVLNSLFSTRLDFACSPIGVNWCRGYPLSQPIATAAVEEVAERQESFEPELASSPTQSCVGDVRATKDNCTMLEQDPELVDRDAPAGVVAAQTFFYPIVGFLYLFIRYIRDLFIFISSS